MPKMIKDPIAIRGKVVEANCMMFAEGRVLAMADIDPQHFPMRVNHMPNWLEPALTALNNDVYRLWVKLAGMSVLGQIKWELNNGRGVLTGREANQNRMTAYIETPNGIRARLELNIKSITYASLNYHRVKSGEHVRATRKLPMDRAQNGDFFWYATKNAWCAMLDKKLEANLTNSPDYTSWFDIDPRSMKINAEIVEWLEAKGKDYVGPYKQANAFIALGMQTPRELIESHLEYQRRS